MTRRINLHLDDVFAAEIEQQKPKSLALSAFCALLIEQGLAMVDRVPNLPACCAGAGKGVSELSASTPATLRQPSNDLGLPHQDLQDSRLLAVEPSDASLVSMGGSVGKEREKTPRTPPISKQIPPDLAQHSELIQAFWRGKKGSRSPAAWSLLLTELSKIRDKYGDPVLLQQLETAVQAGTWTSITLANYERFRPAQAHKPAQPSSEPYYYRPFTDEQQRDLLGLSAGEPLPPSFAAHTSS